MPKKEERRSDRRKLALMEGGRAVSDRTREPPDGFAPRLLVAVNLPYRDPKALAWSRQNGDVSLTVRSGIDERTGEAFGLPYGKYPRLFMYYVTTEAVRRRSREINLGGSLSSFLVRLGIGDGGNQARNFNRQINRLVNAHIGWQRSGAPGTRGSEGEDLRPIKGHRLWWGDTAPTQDTLFPNFVKLDYDFYQEIVDRPVPWRLEAVQAVQSSPLGLDLLMWLSWRTFGRREEIELTWQSLHLQMGSQTSVDEFRRGCLEQLSRIKHVWPELAYVTPPGRLVLLPMIPMVAPR